MIKSTFYFSLGLCRHLGCNSEQLHGLPVQFSRKFFYITKNLTLSQQEPCVRHRRGVQVLLRSGSRPEGPGASQTLRVNILHLCVTFGQPSRGVRSLS